MHIVNVDDDVDVSRTRLAATHVHCEFVIAESRSYARHEAYI